MLLTLRKDLMDLKQKTTTIMVEVVLKYVVKFPTSFDHENHHQGIAAGLIEPLDDRVRDYIKSLVRDGIRRKTEIISRTTEFVSKNVFSGQCRLRRRFKPNSKTINNIIASVKLETKYSKFDQENLKEALEKGLLSDGRYSFTPKGSIPEVEDLLDRLEADEVWDDIEDMNIQFSSGDTKLCFVYQSNEMSRLYRKYAVNLIMLDATHKICKYTIPLFLLVVQTNVNFQVVAIIVVEDESSELLTQALNIVKSWNPDINPKYAMVDFDAAEILSLEKLFEGIRVFLCDFHREQSWTRWVNKKENGVFHVADDVLRKLRSIAKSNNDTDCQQAILNLRSSEIFQTSKLGKYFENTWHPELQRWSRAYRPDDLFRCNTNNGTERLNESLKYETLDGYKNSTLTEIVKTLTHSFLPDLYEKYVSLNIKYTSGHKGYCQSIPKYMINRPGPLVEDMLRKMNKVTPFMLSSVYPVTPLVSLTFEVESINEVTNTKNMYSVRFGSNMQICSCECASFRIDRLLCKHFFAVFKSNHPYGFHNISPLYLNHPYTIIDVDVIGGTFTAVTVREEADLQNCDFTAPSVESVLPSLTASSLPLRRKNRTSNAHQCFARLKVISDKLYNNPDFRDTIDNDLVRVLNHIKELESSVHGEDELGVHEREPATVVSEPTSSDPSPMYPVRRYPNELCIYDELPLNTGKRKHAFSGRYGEVAEVMRKQFKTKVSVPAAETTQSSSVIIDGTTDIHDSLEFDDQINIELKTRLGKSQAVP